MRTLLDSRYANGFLVHFAIWNLLFWMAILLNLVKSSLIVIDEIFSKVIVMAIDPKVIDNTILIFYYIYCQELTKRSGLFACYSNC